MDYKGSTRSMSPRVCVPCRKVYREGMTCPLCRGDLVWRTYRWRAPRRRNARAWRAIERGQWFWEEPLSKLAPDDDRLPPLPRSRSYLRAMGRPVKPRRRPLR